MRRLQTYLVATIIVVIGAITATILSGNAPVLGLDLKGGISVTYQPVGKPKPGALNETLNIMNNRVNSFGVAEPSISRQGNDIIVELPGVKDQAKALRLVGRTAQLRFRPVLAAIPPLPATASSPRCGHDHNDDPARQPEGHPGRDRVLQRHRGQFAAERRHDPADDTARERQRQGLRHPAGAQQQEPAPVGPGDREPEHRRPRRAGGQRCERRVVDVRVRVRLRGRRDLEERRPDEVQQPRRGVV